MGGKPRKKPEGLPTEFAPGTVFHMRPLDCRPKPGAVWIWKRELDGLSVTWYLLRRVGNSYEDHVVLAACKTKQMAQTLKRVICERESWNRHKKSWMGDFRKEPLPY